MLWGLGSGFCRLPISLGSPLTICALPTTSMNLSWTFHFFFFFFFFLRLHQWHMEVPRLGGQSELELPAYTTATAMRDPNFVIYTTAHSNAGSLTPLSLARDQTRNLMVLVRFISAAP